MAVLILICLGKFELVSLHFSRVLNIKPSMKIVKRTQYLEAGTSRFESHASSNPNLAGYFLCDIS